MPWEEFMMNDDRSDSQLANHRLQQSTLGVNFTQQTKEDYCKQALVHYSVDILELEKRGVWPSGFSRLRLFSFLRAS